MHADGKVFRSLKLLLSSPGLLTAEYMRGRRKPYLAPLSLFLIVNLVFFVVYPYFNLDSLTTRLENHMTIQPYAPLIRGFVTRQLARSHQTPEQFAQRFDEVASVEAKSLVIVMVPLFALLTALLQAGRGQHLVRHLTFATHFVAAWLIMTGLSLGTVDVFVMVFGRQHRWYVGGQLEFAVVVGLVSLQAIYLWFAFRAAYAEGRASAAWKAIAASVANIVVVLTAYRFILFFATLVAT